MSKIAVFAQIARLIPHEIIDSIARKYRADRYCKGLDTWTHLMAMLLAQLANFNSLRDVCNNMRGMQKRIQHLGITRAPSRNARVIRIKRGAGRYFALSTWPYMNI